MKYSFGILILLHVLFSPVARAENWTAEDKLAWQRSVKKVVTTPPCCGACSVLSMSEGRKAYQYVTGEEKSEEGGKIYNEHKKRLLEGFQYFNPARFEHWFGNKSMEEEKR